MKKPGLWHSDELESVEEESWLISYADMVTLLFGFFVVLYSFSTVDSKKFDTVGQKVAEAFKSPEKKSVEVTLESNVPIETRQVRAFHLLVSMLNMNGNTIQNLEKVEETFTNGKGSQLGDKNLTTKLQSLSETLVTSKNTQIKQQRTLDLQLAETSLFQAGRAELTASGFERIRELGIKLSQSPGIEEVDVTGHTDSLPPPKGSEYRSNFVLSSLRAGAVAEALLKGGLNPQKVRVSGMGSLQPLVPERTKDGRLIPENQAKNRRVSIMLRKQAYD